MSALTPSSTVAMLNQFNPLRRIGSLASLLLIAIGLMFKTEDARGEPLLKAPPENQAVLSLADERKHLETLKAAELERLKRQAAPSAPHRNAAYHSIAELGTAEAFEMLVEAYEEACRTGRHYPDGPDLIVMLAKTRRSERTAVLLRMVQDGRNDLRLIETYARAAGQDAIPHLLRVVERGNPTQHYQARGALLRLGHPPTVEAARAELERLPALLDELKRDGVDYWEMEELRLALGRGATGVREGAVPLLRGLLAGAAAGEGDRVLRVRASAGALALGLRDRESVPGMIRLLRFPDDPHDRRHFSGGRRESIRSNLERYTRKTFKDAAQWEAWWSSEGHRTPLYVHEGVPVEERGELTAAAIRWAREQSAPRVRGPVTYVYDYFHDEDGPLSTEAVRYYTPAEMRLLGRLWEAVGLSRFVSNGESAAVFMSGHRWACTLELTRDGTEWKVVGAKSHPVQ